MTALENEQQAAAVVSPSNPTNTIIEKLSEQVAALSEQVAALSALQQTKQEEFIPTRRMANMLLPLWERGLHPSKLP